MIFLLWIYVNLRRPKVRLYELGIHITGAPWFITLQPPQHPLSKASLLLTCFGGWMWTPVATRCSQGNRSRGVVVHGENQSFGSCVLFSVAGCREAAVTWSRCMWWMFATEVGFAIAISKHQLCNKLVIFLCILTMELQWKSWEVFLQQPGHG